MHSIIKHPLIGFAIAATGITIDHFNHYTGTLNDIAGILMGVGPTYCIVSFIVILARITVKYLGKRNAAKEFVEIKTFLEKGLISQEEYDKKSADLKSKLL